MLMNLDAKSGFARKSENEEKAPKQLTSMQTDDTIGDNNERIPQLRSLPRYEVSAFVLPLTVSSRL